MDAFCTIVGIVIIAIYTVVAVMLILECETKTGTVWAAIGAIGIGALIAYFIKALVPIIICVFILLTICEICD